MTMVPVSSIDNSDFACTVALDGDQFTEITLDQIIRVLQRVSNLLLLHLTLTYSLFGMACVLNIHLISYHLRVRRT